MLKIFLALTLISGFFSMTGLVYDAGGFGVNLVVKPSPSIQFEFGGGEVGSWARNNPLKPTPWWQNENQILLLKGDWEYGIPHWVSAYYLSIIVLFLAWPVLLLVFLIRLIRQHFSFKTNAP